MDETEGCPHQVMVLKRQDGFMLGPGARFPHYLKPHYLTKP